MRMTDRSEITLEAIDLGIVSTIGRARLPGLPGTVLGLYGGLAMGGKPVHAAFARAKLSF